MIFSKLRIFKKRDNTCDFDNLKNFMLCLHFNRFRRKLSTPAHDKANPEGKHAEAERERDWKLTNKHVCRKGEREREREREEERIYIGFYSSLCTALFLDVFEKCAGPSHIATLTMLIS